MKNFMFIFIFVCLIFSFSVLFFKDSVRNIEPEILKREHSCASDGMVIIDYKGPKAQILWKNNARTFYCEVREAFFESLDFVKRKNILAVFVQDFSNVNWGSYIDLWIKAEDAFYVIDSKKDGAMGITYVPFSDYNKAILFVEKFEGKILKFEDIKLDVLLNSDFLLKERGIF